MKTALFCLFILFLTEGVAQPNDANVLMKNYENRAKWFQDPTHFNRDSTVFYLNKALDLTPNNSTQRADIFDLMADAFNSKDNLDTAATFLEKARAIYEQHGNKLNEAKMLQRLGNNYNRRLIMDKAMQYNFKALAIFEELGDTKGIANSYTNLALDFYYNSDFKKGAEYAEKAIEVALKTGDDITLADAYQRADANYLELKNYKKALEMVNKTIAIKEKLYPGTITLGSALNDRGNVYKFLKEYDKALADYKNALAICEKLNVKRGIASCLANIGHVNLLLNQYEKALPYMLKAIEIESSVNFRVNLGEHYMHTSTIYEKLGDYPKALEFQKKFKEVQDSTFNVERDKTTMDLQTRYETGKKEALLSVKDKELSQQRKIQWLMIGVAFVLLGFLFVLYRSFQARTKSNLLLAEANKQLEAKNAENELLLKEIHHRVKNNLEIVSSLLELQSAQIDDPDIQEAMLASQNRVQSMGILHQKLYQSEHLAFIEMKNYFKNLCENILDSYNATPNITVDLPMKELELDVDTAVPIGLIVNELLTNSLKYAFPQGKSGKITLSLQDKDDKTYELRIADNGVGKTEGVKPQGTGFGTQLVSLLTKQLNGQLEQTVENGTIISIYFKKAKAA